MSATQTQAMADALTTGALGPPNDVLQIQFGTIQESYPEPPLPNCNTLDLIRPPGTKCVILSQKKIDTHNFKVREKPPVINALNVTRLENIAFYSLKSPPKVESEIAPVETSSVEYLPCYTEIYSGGRMRKVLFLAILFSGVLAKAETFYLNDFLFHLKTRINNSRDLGQLVSRMPGTLEQKTAFAKQVRENKLANQAPPKAQINGTKLEIDLTPKLIIDFAQLDKLILTVNGKKLDLRANKDWMGQFNSAYRPGISWLDLFLRKSYASELTVDQQKELAKLHPLESLDQKVASPLEQFMDKAVQKTSDVAGTIYAASVGTYLRCSIGIDECTFFSDAGVIIEKLSEGEYRGLSEFTCEDGKLKKIQALETKDGGRKKISSYEFTYAAGNDEVKVSVKDFGINPERKANCDFLYNSKTKEIRGDDAKNSDKCQIWERSNLRTIAYDTPLDAAFRCCQKKSCDRKVSKFRSDYTVDALKAAGESLAHPPTAPVK
jgi:hypothetical protein